MAITEPHPARHEPAPNEAVSILFPLRLSGGGACYISGGWTGVDTFYVKERCGPFTHWVTVQFPLPLNHARAADLRPEEGPHLPARRLVLSGRGRVA